MRDDDGRSAMSNHDRKRAVAHRIAVKLVGSGVSQRKAAKMLGVNEKTVRNDVRNKSAKGAENIRTGSAAVKARRADAAAGSNLRDGAPP